MQLAATPTASAPATTPAWPAKPWHTWEATADRSVLDNPMELMQAAPIAPNVDAVAQADFAYGGNYMAHGSLDVFTGATIGTFADRTAAVSAAQARGGAAILGVFVDGAAFAVRELLVSDADRRGPGDDHRDERPAPRPRPDRLIALTDVGAPRGDWGHGDYRTLSGLRFVSADLVDFVRGRDHVARA